jgi:membrane associated rhomboid family serine protease
MERLQFPGLRCLPATSAPPIFNLPPVVAATSAVLVVVHLLRSVASREADLEILLWLAFIPARYDPALAIRLPLPGGVAADIWTFVSYALLHGDAMHLIVNLVWFLAFGSAVAWRFGTMRFGVFLAVTAAAGAAAHLLTNFGEFVPLVGASAAISGAMAASLRFVFEIGGPLGVFRTGGRSAFLVPAAPLSRALQNPQVLAFLAIWFLINLGFGLGTLPDEMASGAIAWQAHIGGFLAGLFLFPLFDPVRSPD